MSIRHTATVLFFIAVVFCCAHLVWSYVSVAQVEERFGNKILTLYQGELTASSIIPAEAAMKDLKAGLASSFKSRRQGIIVSIIAFLCVVGFSMYLWKKIVASFREVLRISHSMAAGYFENKIDFTGDRDVDDILGALANIQSSRLELNEHMERQITETEISYCNLEKSTIALNEANSKLSSLNASINIMLNSLNQGLFLFGADGMCSHVFSKACVPLLGAAPSGRHVSDVLKAGEEDRDAIDRVLQLVFSERGASLDAYGLLSLLPDSFIRSDGAKISIEYHPVCAGNSNISAILAVTTDHSAEDEARRLMVERENEALSILRISGNRNLFTGFYHSIADFLSGLDVGNLSVDSLEMLRRNLHTFKGTASMFHLQDLVEWIHETEDRLADINDISSARSAILADLPKGQAILTKIHKRAYDLLGRDFDRYGVTRTLPLSVLSEMVDKINGISCEDGFRKEFVETLMGEPVRKSMATFDINLRELADRYGKRVSPCYFTGDNFLLLTEKYHPLFTSLTHIARNIVSHAIEAPDVRASKGKDPELTVVIETKKYKKDGQEWFVLSFEDDGCGISVDDLRRKYAQLKGEHIVSKMSDADVLACIFEDNVSTSASVNELSGRGVGLSAVKAEAERLGGKVAVESEAGVYTRITIEVPLDWSLVDKAA